MGVSMTVFSASSMKARAGRRRRRAEESPQRFQALSPPSQAGLFPRVGRCSFLGARCAQYVRERVIPFVTLVRKHAVNRLCHDEADRSILIPPPTVACEEYRPQLRSNTRRRRRRGDQTGRIDSLTTDRCSGLPRRSFAAHHLLRTHGARAGGGNGDGREPDEHRYDRDDAERDEIVRLARGCERNGVVHRADVRHRQSGRLRDDLLCGLDHTAGIRIRAHDEHHRQ